MMIVLVHFNRCSTTFTLNNLYNHNAPSEKRTEYTKLFNAKYIYDRPARYRQYYFQYQTMNTIKLVLV